MKSHIIAAALCAMIFSPALAFAETAGGDAAPAPIKPGSDATQPPAKPGGEPSQPPVKPGAARVTTKAPEPDKWDARQSANGMQRVFKCKPLACAESIVVSIVFSKSPTRHPDPQALDKLAKIDLPKNIRAADAAREILTDGAEKIETLTSKTATLKGYPAVINESKFTRGKSSAYADIAIIFAGPVMIRVQSASPNRELAQKSMTQFVEVMRIEEGPPLQPGSPSQPLPAGSEQL